MDFLVYIPRKDESGQRLQRMIGSLVWPDTVQTIRSLKLLSLFLRSTGRKETVVILLASTQEDLQNMLSHTDWFEGFRLILILPDWNGSTMVRGNRLRPLFMTFRESDFLDISGVLLEWRAPVSLFSRLARREVSIGEKRS